MRFDNVLIKEKIKEKILSLHNVTAEEIVEVLLRNPLVLKTREKRYIALGFHNRQVTIIFEQKKSITEIITAYPSSEWQIRLYKRKKQ